VQQVIGHAPWAAADVDGNRRIVRFGNRVTKRSDRTGCLADSKSGLTSPQQGQFGGITICRVCHHINSYKQRGETAQAEIAKFQFSAARAPLMHRPEHVITDKILLLASIYRTGGGILIWRIRNSTDAHESQLRQLEWPAARRMDEA
jgi:hypothetical protein